MSWLVRAMTADVLRVAIEACEDQAGVEAVLSSAGIKWEVPSFPGGEVLFVAELTEDESVVIDPDMQTVTDTREWVDGVYSWRLPKYIQFEDFNNEFWNGDEFVPRLYHGTWNNEADEIMRTGLKPHNETRGLQNRGTGLAIFTTTYDQSRGEGHQYGAGVIEINTAAMKSDGYMPEVNLEEPIIEFRARNRLAWKMGLRDYEDAGREQELENDGMYPTTVVVFDEIPVKYLKRIA